MPKRSQKSRRQKRLESKNSDDDVDDEDNKKAVVEPWKEAGYDSFKAYNDAMVGKITEVTSKVTTLEQTTEQQKATIDELKSQKPNEKKEETAEEKAAREKAEAEANKKPDDAFKAKAAKLYATLTPEQRKKAEEDIEKLPKEVRDIAAGSYEGKYALLKSMIPDHKETVSEESFFGDLVDAPEAKSVSEQLMDALANLDGGKNNMSPERKGSGFVPRSGDDNGQGNKDGKPRPKITSLFE